MSVETLVSFFLFLILFLKSPRNLRSADVLVGSKEARKISPEISRTGRSQMPLSESHAETATGAFDSEVDSGS